MHFKVASLLLIILLFTWFFFLFFLISIAITENEYEENVSSIQRYRPKPIDDLVKETRFTKKEIQLLYRGFKQVCEILEK